MVPLGDEAQVEARFGPFGDSANLDARKEHGLRRTYHRPGQSFWTHMMELSGDVSHLESRFFLLEIVLVSVQDRCMVRARHITGLEIVLDAPDGTTR